MKISNNTMASPSIPTLVTERETQDFDDELGFYPQIDVPLISISFLVLVENFIVVALVLKKETLRAATANILLASLAVCDLLTGVVGIPLFIGCSATTENALCVATDVFIRFSAVLSVLHLLVIAFDRYFMIVKFQYDTLITRTRAVVAAVSIWLFSLLVSLVQLSWYELDEIDVNEDADEKIRRIEKIYFLFCLVVFYCLPLIVMCYLYGRIFSISLRQIMATRQRRANLQCRVPLLIVQLRGSVVVATMLLVFACCWLPYFIIALQHHLGVELFEAPLWAENLVVFLRFTPPLLNPILCAFCKRDIREAVFVSFRRTELRPRRRRVSLEWPITDGERVSTRNTRIAMATAL